MTTSVKNGIVLIHTDPLALIETRDGVRGGKPCFLGTRIAIHDVLEYRASGMSAEEILDDFSELSDDHIRAALAFAAQRERRLSPLLARMADLDTTARQVLPDGFGAIRLAWAQDSA